MLHITNGDHAAERIHHSGIPGDVLSWQDVLHEGPVPAELSPDELRPLRARFIAEQGWGDFAEVMRQFEERDRVLQSFHGYEEVVLWFEHDLFDQLQLLQLLAFFADRDPGATRLSLIAPDDYLGSMPPDLFSALFGERRNVSAEQLRLGRRGWEAFRAPEPTAIGELLREDTAALPFLEGALLRHLQQFPSVRNGLGRSERQALEEVAVGGGSLGGVFAASSEREERIFVGDVVFAGYLQRMSSGTDPLVLLRSGAPIRAPETPAEAREFWEREARVTPTGIDVLEGRADWVRIHGIDRWLGGVHLRGSEAEWRWDDEAGEIRRATFSRRAGDRA